MDGNCSSEIPQEDQDFPPSVILLSSKGKKYRAKKKRSKAFVQRVFSQSDQLQALLKDDRHAKRYADMSRDIEVVDKLGDLYEKYASEHGSWKRVKYNRQEGVGFDCAAFGDFRNFLLHVGPKPTLIADAPRYTCDRINSEDAYKPGNVRWATDQEQSENRGSVNKVRAPDGRQVTKAQIAKETGFTPEAVRQGYSRGKTAAYFYDKRGNIDPVREWQFPQEKRAWWEAEFRLVRRYYRQPKIEFYIERLQQDRSKVINDSSRLERLDMVILDTQREYERRKLLKQNQDLARIDAVISAHAPELSNINPLPKLPPPPPAKPTKQAQAIDCMKAEQEAAWQRRQEAERQRREEKKREKEETDAFYAFMQGRIKQLMQERDLDVGEASSLAHREYQQSEKKEDA